MVGPRRDFFEEPEHLALVVESRKRQPERDEIVYRINVAGRFRPQRELICAVKDIRSWVEDEVNKAFRPIKTPVRVGEQVTGDEDMIVHRKEGVELTGDDNATEFQRGRLDRKIVANLIGDEAEDFRRQRPFDRAPLVEKGNLPQHRIPGRGLGRTIDNPDLVAEVARDPAQRTRISGNSSPLFEREMETIEDDAVGHSDPVGGVSSSYEAEYSALQGPLSPPLHRHPAERSFPPPRLARCRHLRASLGSGLFESFQKALDPGKILAPSQRLVRGDAPADFRYGPVPVGKHANVLQPARPVGGIAIDR